MNSFVNEDISKLGLSERVDAKLKRLQEEKHFADMRDAYRVGIALAIAYGIRPPEIMQPKVNRYNISQIDEDKSIETAIDLLMNTGGVPPYRVAIIRQQGSGSKEGALQEGALQEGALREGALRARDVRRARARRPHGNSPGSTSTPCRKMVEDLLLSPESQRLLLR